MSFYVTLRNGRFMWIMGVCIPFSVKSMVKKGIPMGVSLWNVWKRSAKLFLLGFIWNTIGELYREIQSCHFGLQIFNENIG